MQCGSCDGIFTDFIEPGKCPICSVPFQPKAPRVPAIPSITDVAGEWAGPMPTMPDPVANVEVKKKHQPMEYTPDNPPAPKRQSVDHQTSRLYWPFIIAMGKIAHYANTKYGSVEQYADGRLEGEKSPINHIAGHISDYVSRTPHDKFGTLEMQLAAIAYNAMMEFVYLRQGGGPTVPGDLYEEKK